MTRLYEAKPFIICEIGSNWRDLTDCCDSVKAAKECGADAVKFQLFDEVALYGHGYRVPSYGAAVKPPFLPPAWLPKLREVSDVRNIEFMCTAFSPELVAAVEPYVKVHKVASSDLNYPQLLQAVARTGKPILVSLGAASGHDMLHAARVLGANARVLWLACTAAYPADFCELKRIDPDFGAHGLSDHTLGYTAAVQACRQGAMVLEKHFTAFPDLDTPDRPHSLAPKQFKRMVDIIRGRDVESEESAMHLRHKRRLVATMSIEPGEALRYGENFGAYRSLEDDTRGLSPFRWAEVEGKTARTPIALGKPIGEGDFV